MKDGSEQMAADNRRWIVLCIVGLIILNLGLILHWNGVNSAIALPIHVAGNVLLIAGVLSSRKACQPDQHASTAKSESDA
jgi:uncharacterized membrane protein HdeD (DUF308 family)